MKLVQIYKTNKDFKICTLYKLESGSYITSEPIFIIPIDVRLENLESKLHKALNTSRNLSESEEDEFWLGNNLLKKMKETSFDKLYRTSLSCNVSLIDDIASIIPQKYAGKNRGLTRDGQIYQVTVDNDNYSEVTKKVIEVLT